MYLEVKLDSVHIFIIQQKHFHTNKSSLRVIYTLQTIGYEMLFYFLNAHNHGSWRQRLGLV